MAKPSETGMCKACEGLVSKTALTCPHCGHLKPYKKTKEETKKEAVGCLISGLVLVALIGSCIISPDKEVIPEVWKEGQSEFAASLECREKILNNLIAPSTAKVNEIFGKYKGNNIYFFKFKVDAENSFGAHIRNIFECTVTEKSGSKEIWEDINLISY